MRFIGVDLAWGDRNGTGLCALDGSGRVLDSGRAASNDDIAEWVGPHLSDGAVIAVDAPLIVKNGQGRRPCEDLVSRAFGHRDAAAHSSNRGMPWFIDGGRGLHLASSLDLSVEPAFDPRTQVRRMIEVYPHTALVCLFGLERTIKYKAKRGRTVPFRKEQFDVLVRLLESLGSCEPTMNLPDSRDWRRLRAEVEAATTGTALDRAEDELDAYVCAYVAFYYWYWGTRRCAVVGDCQRGYIVTPVDADALGRLGSL